MEFRNKENLLKVQYERDCQAKEEAFLKNEEMLKSDFSKKLEDKDRDWTSRDESQKQMCEKLMSPRPQIEDHSF